MRLNNMHERRMIWRTRGADSSPLILLKLGWNESQNLRYAKEIPSHWLCETIALKYDAMICATKLGLYDDKRSPFLRQTRITASGCHCVALEVIMSALSRTNWTMSRVRINIGDKNQLHFIHSYVFCVILDHPSRYG